MSDYSNHPVIACKSIWVQDYNSGRSLNSHENMVMELDPAIPRADTLWCWYNSRNKMNLFYSISGDLEKKEDHNNPLRLLWEVEGLTWEKGDKAVYFETYCFVNFIKNTQ